MKKLFKTEIPVEMFMVHSFSSELLNAYYIFLISLENMKSLTTKLKELFETEMTLIFVKITARHSFL